MLNHLKFADDTVLVSHSAAELQDMLAELKQERLKWGGGLRMNMKKTKVMLNNLAKAKATGISITGEDVKVVDEYIYLG